MKKWISLYDLCPVGSGTRNDGTVRITAMAYLKNCPDNARQMEKQLLRTSEYILLRGKHGGGYGGLLRKVNMCAASKISEQAIADLYDSVPRTYQQNAVFLMNAVTLNELRRAIGADAHDWITSRRDVEVQKKDKTDRKLSIGIFLKMLEEQEECKDFSPYTFVVLVEKVIVQRDGRLELWFRNGMTYGYQLNK